MIDRENGAVKCSFPATLNDKMVQKPSNLLDLIHQQRSTQAKAQCEINSGWEGVGWESLNKIT